MSGLRVALAQTNPVVGDLVGNTEQLLSAARAAAQQGAQLLAAGECALTGYVDAYNPLAFGDKFSDWGTPVILIETGSLVNARAAGKVRTEGRDYVMRPDDVVEFRFNV